MVAALAAWIGALPGTVFWLSFPYDLPTAFWMSLIVAAPTAAIAVSIDGLSTKVDYRFLTEWWHTLPLGFVISPIVSVLVLHTGDQLGMCSG